MAGLDIKPVTDAEIAEWMQVAEQLSALKTKESLMRSRIFSDKFTEPHEGVNTTPLGEIGWVLKGDYKLNRKIDEGALSANAKRLREEFQIPMDNLIKYKPELSITEYRKLTEVQRLEFDNILIISAGLPSLKIELPKRAAK